MEGGAGGAVRQESGNRERGVDAALWWRRAEAAGACEGWRALKEHRLMD